MLKFVPAIKDLAEGKLEPAAWVAWWNEHGAEVQASCLPGWSLRLKPRFGSSSEPDNGVAASSQGGAYYVLDALKIPYEPSPRYEQGSQEEFKAYRAAAAAKKAKLAEAYGPSIEVISKVFPKFARFLKKNPTEIELLDQGADETELNGLEHDLGLSVPTALRRWLRCTRSFRMGSLEIGMTTIFLHQSKEVELPSEGMLCIADYFLESDGDQVLFDLARHGGDDPPVFYYAHYIPKVRKLASTFTGWIESLPRKLLQ